MINYFILSLHYQIICTYLPQQKLINSITALVTSIGPIATLNVPEPKFMEKFFPYAHKYSRSVMDLVTLYVSCFFCIHDSFCIVLK